MGFILFSFLSLVIFFYICSEIVKHPTLQFFASFAWLVFTSPDIHIQSPCSRNRTAVQVILSASMHIHSMCIKGTFCTCSTHLGRFQYFRGLPWPSVAFRGVPWPGIHSAPRNSLESLRVESGALGELRELGELRAELMVVDIT